MKLLANEFAASGFDVKHLNSLDAFRKRSPSPSPDQTVEWLYLSTLSRRPTSAEQAEAQRYLNKMENSPNAYVGVLWMLVNRSEYLLVR